MYSPNEKEVLRTVLDKARKDPAFKQELISAPVEAIKKVTGVEVTVPEGRTLVVEDQTDPSVIFINIPPRKNTDDVELTEDQLELVAGGGDIRIPPIFDPGPIFICPPYIPPIRDIVG